jgi:hypothetical protein
MPGIVDNNDMSQFGFSLRRVLGFAALAGIPGFLFAARKVVSPTASAANDNVEITAILSLDQPEVAQKLGVDPGKGIVLLEVRVSPKTDKGLRISPDDFYLLSHDDGQRSQPFEPDQLAGKGGLVLGQGPGTAGELSRTPGAPIGTGPMGRVQRMPGAGNGIGNSGGQPGGLKTQTNDKDAGNSTLLTALKAKQLPDTTTADEVSGYLLFPLDGKHKLKNMAVLYRGQAGHLDLEFQH